MTNEQFKSMVRNATGSFRKAAAVDLAAIGHALAVPHSSGKVAKLERDLRFGTLGTVQTQRRDTGRFLVRITSIRKRLLDEDNLCEKYHVDCCRYAGLLPGDAPGQTKIEVCQQKVDPGGQEEVRIEIFRL